MAAVQAAQFREEVFHMAGFSQTNAVGQLGYQGERIPPEKLKHVFNRFYRGEESTSNSCFRLGLPIAKKLVNGMAGEIEVKSELGNGCVVKMRFHSSQRL